MNLLAKLRIDGFLLGLFAAMALGVLLPARGDTGQAVETATKVAIAVLFLLYGTRLEPREALEGLKHWRLHTTVLAATFVLFPLLGLAMKVPSASAASSPMMRWCVPPWPCSSPSIAVKMPSNPSV